MSALEEDELQPTFIVEIDGVEVRMTPSEFVQHKQQQASA